MRKLFYALTPLFFAVPLLVSAQYPCTGSGRYFDEVFTAVTVTSNVNYGSAKDVNNTLQTLSLDIYEPTGDTASKRPLIVFGHGGSFIGGTKTDGDVVALCNRFAKRGYVCVSYNYRLGIGLPIDQAHASKAVYRATQDSKAVIRYFRKDEATTNLYKIDPNYIYLGGSSAGAFIALHHAYLDVQSEVPSYIDTAGIGTIEGTTGNPGYSSEINAVVNLCGALGDKSWMHAGDEPLCSMHGTVDGTVPYATALLYISGVFPIMVVDGSHTLDSMARALGIDDTLHTWYGADHVPYASSTAYMDSTVEFVRDFLCKQNAKTSASGIRSNRAVESKEIRIAPNVSNTEIHVLNQSSEAEIGIQLFDMTGRMLLNTSTTQTDFVIQRNNIPSGIYLVQIQGKSILQTQRIVFVD